MEEVYGRSLRIAATQVRHYIEVNCTEKSEVIGKPRYVLDSYETDLNEPSFVEHHKEVMKAYQAWIRSVCTTFTREQAIDLIGYWPVLANGEISFQGDKHAQ